MAARLERRRRRAHNREPITFLDPASMIARTRLTVQAARDGRFDGAEIPTDLRRQWIQGTGPGAKPRSEVKNSIRNIAHALLSGADGWMFDGEDAMGQVDTMSLDNQRTLNPPVGRAPLSEGVAGGGAGGMNAWAGGFRGRPIIGDWRRQLEFTPRIFRARGLPLDDRHVRHKDGTGFSASITDAA